MTRTRNNEPVTTLDVVEPDVSINEYEMPTLTLDAIDNNLELKNAVEFVALRAAGFKMETIADHYGIGRSGLYKRLEKWENEGLLEKARHINGIAPREDMATVRLEIYSRFPRILRRIANIAENSKSEFMAIQAAMLLDQRVIQPYEAEIEQPSDDESKYARKNPHFDPMIVPAPNFKKLTPKAED